MSLFNRFGGESRNGEENRENRGRKDQGNRRAKGARNILADRKLSLEALEERQLLSVNPIGSAEYQDIRASYASLSLPEDFNKINVIEITDLTAASLQAAFDQAAQTTTDDLVVLRTDSDNYTLNLESTAVTVNIDSTNYGKLTVVGFGSDAPVIETVNTNAVTVLNGDATFDGFVVYNYSNIDYAGDSFVGTKDAQITLGDTLVVVNQTTKTDEATGELTTSYAVDRVATAEELEQAGISNSTATSAYRTVNNPHGDGDDYNSVRNSVHAVMRTQYDYFGYSPATYWASGLSNGSVIYDAESVGYAGWVGTVANMLAYTGWAQQAGFSTRMTLSDGSTVTYNSVEDAVAAYLMNGFIDTGAGTAYNWSITAASILDYFFAGNDENCFGRNYSSLTNTIEGGGFFQNINFGKVGGYTAASDTMLQEMLSVLRKGNAVTMEVQTSDSYGNVSREYVSVWGYVYNRDSRVYYGNTTNEAATTVGLICSNPTKSAYEQQVTDSRYNNTENNQRTLTHYVERNSTQGDVYDTYHTYLLSGSGSNLTLVHAPYTYLDSNGAVQGAINFPENFCFYGNDNTSNNTYTSRILGFSWLQQYSANLSSVEINQNSVLSLESMPGNTDNVIYLYFGGVDGTADGVEHPGFTLDNSAGYSAAELKMIEEIWRRVAEDYAPFNVNVTTSASVWASASRGVRCVIGGYHSDHGGVSGVGIFGASKSDNYVYPFSLGLSAKNIAEAASHEVGHSLGLSHDGYEHSGYYDGDYSGNTTWAPIMGTAYGAAISQWSKGEYVGATNLEDDIAIIASNLGFRPDDAGDTVETASDLANFYVGIDINSPSATAGTYNVVGYIETRDDYDVYSFKSYGGTYVVDVVGDGADDRYIDSDFSWTTRRHSDTENAAFAGLYYAKSYDYTNLNLKVELLDEEGEIVLLDKNGSIMKLSFGESIVLRDSDYYFYVVDQFGRKVYDDAGNLKEGYQAVDDSVYTTFSHFVTPKLEEGKTYYIRVTGVGEGNPSTTGYSDYGSLGKYTLSLHESYENFRIDAEQVDVSDLTYATGVDNVLNWQEAFVYANRRLENGRSYLGNTLTFNESLTGSTLNLRDTLLLTRSTSITGQPYSPKRFVFNAMNAWDTTNDQPGITINAKEKFRAVYVDNTTVEMYGFTITGGVAETSSVIYLYFGGLEEGDTGWSGELHPALDFDGDPTSFSSEELEVINEVYLRVAEDYAPYNVTVTTDQSVFEAATNAIRVVIGGTGNGRGGVAYVGSFGTQKQDCYVFPNSTGGARNAKGIAEAVSHEVGHTMGLGHDGIDSSEYYGGSGLWGPIMGSPYGSTITQWSKGEYAGATNSQDDIAIIAGRLGFKEDDYGDTIKDASALSSSYLNAGNLVADGIITNEKDVDFFYFVAMDSTYVIDVVGSGADFSRTDADGYATSLRITNIDLLVKVYDENGTLLYTCDPTDSVFAHFQIDGLEVGEKYYFSVEGTGYGDPKSRGEGYSAYGSIGQFYVTVSATTLANFVGEERYESVAAKKAIQTAAAEANYIKGETYDQVGQTNNGGGVYNHYGWLTIGNSIIAGNRAYKAGGGVYNQGGEYRNTDQHDGWLYLVNTSIVGNFATSENAIGGGIYNEDGGVATLVNVTVAGNTADYSGGGIENAGIARVYNSIVGNNAARYGADLYTEAGNSTYVYSSLIGDESRNASLLAQHGGEDSYNADGYSVIGKSAGTTVASPVTTYDPGFVAYRDYDRDEWSQELWKFWNLRLSAESLAVDLGANYLASNLDYTNRYVMASSYNALHMSRYFTDFPDDLAGQTRVGGSTVDAGAYELLAVPELTGYIPTSAGSDVVNNWENSIVVSRAIDDQTGSIAPFLVDETLYLNLSFINEGAKISDSFETTVYLWKFDAYTKKADMYEQATQETGVPIMTIRVDFVDSGTFPGGAATVTCTNLATGDVQTFDYDGSTSYLVLENVTLGSIETIVSKLIENGDMSEQNEEGYYLFGYGIDSSNAIAELRENNNFFRTTSYFDVVESPVSINDSIVVTTDLDVVDPYDGLISLREAVEVYAGSYYYREIALQEGDTFEANGITYVVKDGKFYVDSASNYQVYPGEQFFVDSEVEIVATWDETNGVFVDANGDEISVPAGATITRGGVEYVYNGVEWLDDSANPYAMTDGETVSWTETQTTTVTYVQNVYLNADKRTFPVSDGTVASIDGTKYELVDGVWTHTETTNSYDRDAIQRMGVFTLEDGTEVAIVNGVFRRVATNDVAIVRDGDVVTLADGSTAVYNYAQDRFVVTEVTRVLLDGDVVTLVDGTTVVVHDFIDGSPANYRDGDVKKLDDGTTGVYIASRKAFVATDLAIDDVLRDEDEIEVNGEKLVFKTDEYVDETGTVYVLEEGTEVTLSNGYEVVYRNGKFVYKTLTQNVGKIAAGTEVIWNGESFTYKAGLALMQRVSRESNAVVFDPKLDGATFVLVDGPLTLDKTFTLDCVDPDGNLLDLTITSSSDDPCLFSIVRNDELKKIGDAHVMNFKFVNATSTEPGSIFENDGVLTLENVIFANNTMEKGNLIFNSEDAKLTVITSSFSGNTATEGALIYNLGDASIVGSYNEGTTSTVYTSFIGDSARLGAIYNGGGTLAVQYVDFQKTSAENGGAIHVNGGSATIANDVFTETSANGMGGAIFATNLADVQIDDVSFANTSATKGGAIAVHSGATANVTTATFDSTSATEEGGAIYNNAGTINIEGATFTNGSATDGGAIYNAGVATLVSPVFDNNVATNQGGAVYSADGSGLTFNANEAGDPAATFTNNSANQGGALYADTPVSFNGDLVATGNSATDSFGAAYVHGRLTVTGSATFENNTAANVGALGVAAEATLGKTRFANNSSTGDYGAAYFGLIATVDSLELVDNTTAGDGSALYVVNTLTIGDYAILSGNRGGGIQTGSDVAIGGSLTATDNVGGAIISGGSVTTAGDATITGNTAEDGGAINAAGLVLIKGCATVSGNTATTGVGGAFKVGSFEVQGEFSASGNKAAGDGGAIYSDGAVKLNEATFENNEAQGGGAIYSNGDITIAYGSFVANKATTNGGAIYAGAGLSASNTLFAKNVAGGLGGAIYGAGTTSLVNVTIASNEAADGAGLYNAGVATVDNSILAYNVATGSGYDLFTATGATTTLRGSLLANVAQIGDVAYTLDAAYRSLLGVDPQLDGDYRLTAGSLAVNTGFNELDGGAATDLNGDARRVGLTIGGVVRTVDMGAYEFQTVIAPDLAIVQESVDYWQTEIVVDGGTVELAYFLAGQDVCINFNAKNVGNATVVDNFKYNVTLVGVDSQGNEVYRSTQAAVSYAKEFDVFDWLNQSDWIYAGDEQRLVANFGVLPVGYYTVKVALDVEGVGAVYEWGEEDDYAGTDNNNLYESTFTVKELPSTVVTTEKDVVDEVDGETSLREAIDNAASYKYVTTFLVADGTQFTTDGGEVLTVSDGWLVQKVDVVYKNGVAYDLQEGDEFLLNGKKIYYHYQLNGGYFAYANGNVADVSSGVVTYPDGTQASFDLQTEQYIHYVDESDLNYREGDRYTYNVLHLTSGDVLLRDGMQFDVQNVKFTYVQNAAYPNGAFLFEDGSVVDYADGAELVFASLEIGTLSTRNARVLDSITLEDGSTLLVQDGVAKLTREVTPVVTFASKLQGSTITVDPAQGPLDVTLYANLGKRADNGQDFYLAREVDVEGEDRAVTVSGDNATRVMNVEADATITVADLAFERGLANSGGAVFNEGVATFKNVDFSHNNAVWQKTTVGGDALYDGLGGAIINYGTLAVEGGKFVGNGVLPESADEYALNGTTEFGGAIFSAGDTTITGASFADNEAYAGAAVAAIEGTLTVANSSFSGNVAERAAAIYTMIPTTVIASTFTNNTAEATSFTSRNVNGGAIYARNEITFKADPTSESTVAATFDGNKAEIAGALYAERNVYVEGDIVATNNSAVKNTAYATDVANDYGAFYVVGTLTVDGSATLTGNSADGSYGALYATAVSTTGALTVSNNTAAESYGAFQTNALTVGGDLTATGNTASNGSYGAFKVFTLEVAGNATVTGNKAAGDVGAIYANTIVIGDAATPATIVVSENEAGANYGAIYVAESFTANGSVEAKGNKAATIPSKETATAADGTVVTTTTYSGRGGALYVKNGDATITGAANFSDNEAATFGAIYVGGELKTGELTLSGNKAIGKVDVETTTATGETTLETTNVGSNYGAAYVKGAITVDGNATITNNSALAAVGAVQGTSMKVNGELVASGNAAGGEAGAIRLGGGLSTEGSATFSDNTAGGSAGALKAAEVAVGGSLLVSGNSAAGAYGAFSLDGALVVVDDATFDSNTAGSQVGAVLATGVLIGGNATVSNNVATSGSVGAVKSQTFAVVGDALVTKNTAGQDVGAVFAADTFTIGGNATITDNSAAGDIGAINAGSILIGTGADPIEVVISGNKAGANVGAVYAQSTLEINGSVTATNNAAATSPNVETAADGTVTTTVSGSGGAIFVELGDATITGAATFTNNSAGTYGAIYVGGAFTTGDLTLDGNSAIGAVTVETPVPAVYDDAGNVVTEETTSTETTNDGANYGAAYVGGAFTVNGTATITNNSALNKVGAVYVNSLTVDGAATITKNVAGGDAGAIYAVDSVSLRNSTITENKAGGIAGAIKANFVELVNSLVANNAAAGDGGAIYVSELTLVNVTVANNSAANGGGLYVAKSAKIDNSILAGNSVGEGGSGADIYATGKAKITLRSSLLQNAESTGEKAFGVDWLVAEYRSFIGTDPLFTDAANGDFTLQAASPIVNGGSNALATQVGDFDLAGATRYVGLVVGGDVYAIDLGAYEFQTITAADLAFSENPINFWYGSLNDVAVDYYFAGEDVILDFSILNSGDAWVTDKFSVSFAINGVTVDGSTYDKTVVYRYVAGSQYFDWLDEENWIKAGDSVAYARQNLGALPIGSYTLTITLDVDDEVTEYGEEDDSTAESNNVYTTSFEIHEVPSVVVTTKADGAYNPLDDKVTLREAVELYAGPTAYTHHILVDDATYVDADMNVVTVKDGVATMNYNVVRVAGEETAVSDGDKFAYRNTFITYDPRTATFTYPDGNVEYYARTNYLYSLTLTAEDGSQYVVKPELKIEYLENIGQPYSDTDLGVYVDVVISPDGVHTLLENVGDDTIVYGTENLVYRKFVATNSAGVATSFQDGDTIALRKGVSGTFKNGAIVAADGSYVLLKSGDKVVVDDATLTWVGAAFVYEDGDNKSVRFVDGATVETLKGTLEMGVAQKTITGSLDLADGSSVVFNEDGSVTLVHHVDNNVVFSDKLVAKPVVITLDGSEITIAKDMTINAPGADNVTINGGTKSGLFAVNANVEATISTLKLINGSAITGGAITNHGTLTLNEVNFTSNRATSDGSVDSDKILHEGLGGAIFNTGALAVNGGQFSSNTSAFFGGAIYSVGSLSVNAAKFTDNASGLNGGAVFVLNSSATIADSIFSNNSADRNGGAVALSVARNSGAITITNSKLVDNTATSGGAVYGYAGPEGSASVSLVNATVAGNQAEVGGGVYAENATVSLANTIVAKNIASEGVDVALVSGSTASATSSLIGDGENIGTGALTVVGSFVGTTAAPIDPMFAADYALAAASPAINSGSNELAVYADGSAIETDVNGGVRIVGVERDGVIYSVDMGAIEYQKVVGPDLTFPTSKSALTGWYTKIDGVSTDEFVEGWEVCFDSTFGNFGQATVYNSFDYTITIAKLDETGAVVEGSEKSYTRTYGEEVGGFLPADQALTPNAVVSDSWNLGVFSAGKYSVTLTVDVGDKVAESNEDNNVYSTTFTVAERPSLVVTTAEDVVDAYDGLTSLREAIARVSETGSSTITETRPLANGDSFTLAAYEELGVVDGTVATYADGAITFVNEAGETVALQTGVAYPLTAGGALTFNGGDSAILSEILVSTITFSPTIYGSSITLTAGELVIDRSMEIDGDGANITIDANDGRAFMIAHGDEVVIRGLTVAKGVADKGGAIYNAANLVLTNMTFSADGATESGGAIFNADGATINASNVSFSTSSAPEGGAIYNAGELALSEANFTGSSATTGAAIYNAGTASIAGASFAGGVATSRAGAIYNAGTLDVMNAIFEDSTAQYGGAIVNYQGRATIVDTTFANNVATRDAGAIDNYGELMLSNVEFSGNKAQGFGGAIYNSMSSTTAAYLVELDGVSFTGNSATRGGAIYNSTRSVIAVDSASNFSSNSATEDGGAIYNLGTFTSDVATTFIANEAQGNGGALFNGTGASTTLTGASFASNVAKSGGAVYNAGTFNATTSNFESNVASTDGGAISAVSGSTTSVSNSVVWKNSAGANGGAILSAGTLKLRNTTVAGNAAAMGGGLYTTGSASVYNTIVAGNYAPKGTDLYSTRAASVYNSLIGVITGSGAAPTMVQSKTGEPGFVVGPIFTNGVLSNANLVNLALQSSSAAVNVGNDAWALDATGEFALEKDYAGNDRICTSLDSVDMGAYEFPFEEPTTVVNTDKDVYDLTDGVISIREAIDYAVRLGQDTVTIDPSVTEISLDSTLEINDSIKIVAESEDGLTLTSNGFNGSVVVVGSTTAGQKANVELENIAITNGRSVNPRIKDDPNYIGGGLCNYATLTLTNVTIDGNEASYGGGFYNAGEARVIGSTISNNKAEYYGGVYNRGKLYVEDSTIAGNTASYYGGGLGTYTDATIVNSTIIGNVARRGAGVYEQVNATDLLTSDTDMATTIVNSTITGNVATELGAGVWANHILNVDNSIVYGNVAPKNADLYYTTVIGSSVATFRYSNVGVSNVKVTGTGVKSVDPGFKSYEQPTKATATKVWEDWDLSLAIGSAMIDAGSTALARGDSGALTLDHAGLTRVVNKSVDIGAYEEQGNTAPTDLVITLNPDINSSLPAGSVIATLSAVDADEGDSFTYKIVDDASGVLTIDGDKVVLTAPLSAGNYTATIVATDDGGATVQKTFEFVVSDPSATNYATPTITAIGVAASGDVVVVWSTEDPAKEYVVEYRVKGTSKWQSTGSLTGTFGTLVDANFKVGDVVQARIKALTSSTKNESSWSDVVEYEIAAPIRPFQTSYAETTGATFHAATVTIESNVEPHAWWAIDWNDGTGMTTVTGLSMSQALSHIYMTSGVYTPILYVDNQDGVALDAIVVNVASSSGAVLDVVAEPVFSELEPVSVYGPVPVAPELLVLGARRDSTVSFQTSDEEITVETAQTSGAQIVVDALAAPSATRATVALDAFFADMGQEDDEFETELDDAIFSDDFIGELFED